MIPDRLPEALRRSPSRSFHRAGCNSRSAFRRFDDATFAKHQPPAEPGEARRQSAFSSPPRAHGASTFTADLIVGLPGRGHGGASGRGFRSVWLAVASAGDSGRHFESACAGTPIVRPRCRVGDDLQPAAARTRFCKTRCSISRRCKRMRRFRALLGFVRNRRGTSWKGVASAVGGWAFRRSSRSSRSAIGSARGSEGSNSIAPRPTLSENLCAYLTTETWVRSARGSGGGVCARTGIAAEGRSALHFWKKMQPPKVARASRPQSARRGISRRGTRPYAAVILRIPVIVIVRHLGIDRG